MPDKVDVVICGSGSAGLCAATWLATYKITCKILESRDGPMKIGQADGVQCRTVEIFESFGLGEELLRESYHVNEVVFWADQDNAGGIRRTGRTADTPAGLSHQPHVILNQARVNGLLLECMRRRNSQHVTYGCQVKNIRVDQERAKDPEAFAVVVTAEKDGREQVIEAKYALACDGAHSTVRRALGFRMVGDSSDAIWGVMDTLPRTNFPDIRKKTSIRSKSGNLLIIPREGGYIARFYIELPPGTNAREVTLDHLQTQARRIFSPFDMEFVETVWWSAYSIGQRHADRFHKDHRVFLAGDACHTHSPKAGQGMNVSLQDGYNIGWKLAHVLRGLAAPSLLETYVLEREKVAIDLINFDRYFSRLFKSESKASPAEFQEGFIQSGKFTAGLSAQYDPSVITTGGETKALAANIVVGMRLPSAQVVRYCDSEPMQLAKVLKSDGRWRILIFAPEITAINTMEKIHAIGSYLAAPGGPVCRLTPTHMDRTGLIEPVLVGFGDRHLVEMDEIPVAFRPYIRAKRVRDIHNIYFDDESYNKSHGNAYKFLGIDPKNGAIVIVRPDQCVSTVIDIDQFRDIGHFFEKFLLPQGPNVDACEMAASSTNGVC